MIFSLNILFFDEIGQISAKLLFTLYIILRKVRRSVRANEDINLEKAVYIIRLNPNENNSSLIKEFKQLIANAILHC